MAVVEMEKYKIVAHESDAAKLVALLHDLGISELTSAVDEDLHTNEIEVFDHHRDSSRLDTALNFLSKFHEAKGLKNLLEGGRVETTPQKLKKQVAKFKTEEVVNEAQRLETELNEANRTLTRLDEEYHLLHTWERLSLPLHESMETNQTITTPLRGSVRNIESFQEALQNKNDLIAFEKVGDTTFMVAYFKKDQDLVNELITTHGLEKVALPKSEGTVAQALKRIEEDKEKTTQKKITLEESAKKFAQKNINDLKVASDYYLWKKQELDLALSAKSTENVRVFEAWIPKSLASSVEKKIEKEIPHAALTPDTLREGEVPPTEISNNGAITPFETVTRLYGLPTHKDLDPTPFLSLFFFIFFGLSLGDVGYGLTLIAITGFLIYKYHLDPTVKQLLGLLFYGGLGSVIAGVFLGGYLGISAEQLPTILQKLQLVDPVQSPLPIFYLSLSLGFAHIAFGIWLSIWRQVKAKDTLNGILDGGPWLMLFVGLLLFGLSQFGLLTNIVSGSTSWVNWFIYAALGLIVLTQGRTSKNIFAKLLFGVLSLYNIVGYFSDVLSYSRILALGLATSALSFSINLIAIFIGGLLPGFLGTLTTILILIAGHTLNVTIGIMSAFIHSARLQFVEFFSKFLIGSGRTFKPFLKEQRNVILLSPEKL